jgi:hypothetical protein
MNVQIAYGSRWAAVRLQSTGSSVRRHASSLQDEMLTGGKTCGAGHNCALAHGVRKHPKFARVQEAHHTIHCSIFLSHSLTRAQMQIMACTSLFQRAQRPTGPQKQSPMHLKHACAHQHKRTLSHWQQARAHQRRLSHKIPLALAACTRAPARLSHVL